MIKPEELREKRKEKGLTLRQLEEITGISNAYLSQLETGKIKKPSHYVIDILNKALSNEVQLFPLDFVEWLGDGFIKINGGWIPKYSNQVRTKPNTTSEIFKLYINLIEAQN